MPDPVKYPALPDIVHDFIPPLGLDWMSGLLFYADGALSLGCAFVFLRWGALPKATRYFCAWGATWYIRTVFLISTGLPPTSGFYCRYDYPNYPDDFPHPLNGILRNTIVGMLSFGVSNIHCGDLLFSGHATILTLDLMFIITYFRNKTYVVVLSTLITLLAYFVVIVERRHYTVDVVCGVAIASLMWHIHTEHLPFYICWITHNVRKRNGSSASSTLSVQQQQQKPSAAPSVIDL
jgi:hypothetical protein